MSETEAVTQLGHVHGTERGEERALASRVLAHLRELPCDPLCPGRELFDSVCSMQWQHIVFWVAQKYAKGRVISETEAVTQLGHVHGTERGGERALASRVLAGL